MLTNVAPCWAIRTAGLPIDVVDGKEYKHPIELLRRSEQAAASAREAGASLAEHLHFAVNRLAGHSDLAGTVLQLRRDAHKCRVPSRRIRNNLTEIKNVLSVAECSALDLWLEQLDKSSRVRHRYESSVEKAVARTHSQQLEALKHEEILRGLAIASPPFCLRLLKETPSRRASKQRRLERSVARYATRISRKVSPFSTLSTVVTQSPETTAEVAPNSVIQVAPALHQTLLEALAISEADSNLVLVAPTMNVPSPLSEACGRVLLPLRSSHDDFFYAEDIVVDLPRELEQLISQGAEHTIHEWSRILGRSIWSLTELITDGLLTPQITTGRFEEFITNASKCNSSSVTALNSIIEAESAVGDSRPYVRAQALQQLRQRSEHFVASHEGVAPSWMKTAPLVHETCATDPGLVPIVPECSLRKAMEDIAEFIRPTIIRSSFYEAVTEAFRALSGSARRMPLTEFVISCVASPSITPITSKCMSRDYQRLEQIRLNGTKQSVCLDGLDTIAPATFTAFLQPIGSKPDSWTMAALNRVNQGPGGLLVRWGELPGCAEHLSNHYTPWLQALHPGTRIAALTTGESWSGVQRIPDGILPRLLWPTSNRPTNACDGDLLASDLDLVLDSATDTLQVVVRATEQPVALPYMGVIPQHLLQGAGKILHTLTDPWIYDFRLGLEAIETQLEPHLPLETIPRQMAGTVVIRRSAWRVQTKKMPLVGRAAIPDSATILAEYHRWRLQNDIPRRVYAKAGGRLAGSLRHNKPQFIDLDDPISLSLLLRLADQVPWVSIEEALPDTDVWWPILDHAPRCMEITASMALGSGNRR